MFVLLSFFTLSSGLVCSYLCDNPICEPVCQAVCAPANCSTVCTSPAYCYAVNCYTTCPNMTYNGACPNCETHCSPLTCIPSGTCQVECTQPSCGWKCSKPSNCPQPRCELQCEQPVCSTGNTLTIAWFLLLFLLN